MPAAVFQAVLVGGGYGTGREVVEFISVAGPSGGLLSVGWVFLAMALILLPSFEFARVFQTYDYRHFFQALLGRGWWVFELLAIALMTLVLAVVMSAAATMTEQWFGVPPVLTGICVIAVTVVVLLIGEEAVERLLTAWAAIFSIFLIATVALVVAGNGDGIFASIAGTPVPDDLGIGGVQFALYNIAAIPVLLYTVAGIRTRSEALISALIAAVAGALPALLMHLALIGEYPDVLQQAVPLPMLLEKMQMPWLLAVYGVLLVGTIIQTAMGILQGVIERINGWRTDQGKDKLSPRARGILVGVVLSASGVASTMGIITLIASGYGTLAWGFMLVYALPIVTLGSWRIMRAADPAQA